MDAERRKFSVLQRVAVPPIATEDTVRSGCTHGNQCAEAERGGSARQRTDCTRNSRIAGNKHRGNGANDCAAGGKCKRRRNAEVTIDLPCGSSQGQLRQIRNRQCEDQVNHQASAQPGRNMTRIIQNQLTEPEHERRRQRSDEKGQRDASRRCHSCLNHIRCRAR